MLAAELSSHHSSSQSNDAAGDVDSERISTTYQETDAVEVDYHFCFNMQRFIGNLS